MVQQRGLVADLVVLLRSNLEQFGPFHHPHLGEFLPVEQRLDELVAFLRVGIGEEFGQLIRLRQQSGDVQKTAPRKSLIGAQIGWGHAQLVQFVIHQIVDVIVRHQRRLPVVQPLRDDDDLAANCECRKTRHNECLPAVVRRDHAVRGYGCAVVVVALEDDQRCDIAIRAVGVPRDDGHLLGRTFSLEQQLGRQDLDASRLGDILGVVGCAVLNPFHEGIVIRRPDVEAFAAGVRHGLDCFLDDQTLGGQGEVQPARAKLAGDAMVVAVRVVAK